MACFDRETMARIDREIEEKGDALFQKWEVDDLPVLSSELWAKLFHNFEAIERRLEKLEDSMDRLGKVERAVQGLTWKA